MQQKVVRVAQKYAGAGVKEADSSLFDEAQASVFAEMLPYWITFSRNFTPPPDNRPIPSTYVPTDSSRLASRMRLL